MFIHGGIVRNGEKAMLDSFVIGAICFFVILIVDKLIPNMERWKKALLAAVIATISV